MKDYIEERAITIANFIIESSATVRQTAKQFGISKSTVHKDMETRLPALCGALKREVDAVFSRNKAERHLRGGEATRRRYARMRDEP